MAGRHVALLRGINVGRAKRVAMADLRALITSLGYGDVATLLNSGNVVFTVPSKTSGDPGDRIEKAILTKLGVQSRVSVLTPAELAAIVGKNPLDHLMTNPSRFLVTVLSDARDRALLAPLAQREWAPDALAIGKRWAYAWCASGVLESPLSQALGKLLGDRATSRNWATMTKLHALATE